MSSSDNENIIRDNDMILPRHKLLDIVANVSPSLRIDKDAQDALIDISEQFLARVVHESCEYARHRNSLSLCEKDVTLFLEKQFGIGVSDIEKPLLVRAPTEEFKNTRSKVRKIQQ